VGTYELTVTASGFKKAVRQNISLEAGLTGRIDVTLEVGATSDVITVTSDALLLKTETTEISHNVTIDRADNLPLLTLTGAGGGLGNIRNPLQVIQLLPGASFTGDTTLRLNGLPANTQAIRIEGQDATNADKAGQHIRNRIRRNDYGVTFGGPIHLPKLYDGHDKTFFFFNFEQYRESTTTSNTSYSVPTDAYRGGDFTQANAGLANI